MSPQTSAEYVLGTGGDELARLALQHRIWADAAAAAWKRAGIGPRAHVLDVGCGPGYATLDLAQLVTRSGRVCAVDESRSFLDFLTRQTQAQGLSQVQVRQADALHLSASFEPGELFDAIYCRWVLCWLKDPAQAVREMRKLLKPGGKLIIHDYFNWRAMTAAPRSEAIEAMIQSAVRSFIERDGDPDVGGKLPAILRSAGLELIHFAAYPRVARGGGHDSTLEWVLDWWRTYGPKLVEQGKLAAATYAEAARDLDTLEKDPDRFFFCPPVFEFIARA